MTIFFDEKDEINQLISHTGDKSGRMVNTWEFHAFTRFDKLPLHQEFTIVMYIYDKITKVKIGCNRFVNCRLVAKNYEAKTIKISMVMDRFYNNSEQGQVRADKIDAFENE